MRSRMAKLRFSNDKWNHMFHDEVDIGGGLDNGRDDRFIGMWKRIE